ncbi:MAG TPA: phosphatidate cytidylyltransferase [Opitutaceae bacterium]|nr:phosphatidate cytidylyltransferase [Opitutaceae bacterium]
MPFTPIELRFGLLLLLLLAGTWLVAQLARSGQAAPGRGRALSQGLVYAAAYAACVLPAPAMLAVLSLVGMQMVREWMAALAPVAAAPVPRLLAVLAALAAPWLLYSCAPRNAETVVALAALAVFGLLLGDRSWPRAAAFVPAVVCAACSALAFDAFAGLRRLPGGARLCLFAFFVVNVGDTAAYVCGKLAGRRRLAPRISPGKTVEGALGSLGAAVLAGFVFDRALALHQGAAFVLGAAVLLNLLGLAGDLLTSRVKRRVGIKDFGAVLPGHGGVLDRLDSCLLAVPAFLILVRMPL